MSVHIRTPPEFYYQQDADAIDREIHVLLEKPCTIYAQEHDDLYRRAGARGVLLSLYFTQLFMPLVLRAASVIDPGELKRAVQIDIYLDLNALVEDGKHE
jgi:predicted dehydrogenase